MQQHQRIGRHAGLVQQRDQLLRDEGRLFGRLGRHRIARRQRRRDLAGEDGEREVPRADADEHAAAMQSQLVVLAGRAGQRLHRQALLGLVGVVAQEVHRLAHLGHAVAQRLVRLLDEQAAELGQPRIERIGGAAQCGGALGQRHAVPAREGGVQALHGGVDLVACGLLHRIDARRCHRAQQRLALREAGEVRAGRVRSSAVQRLGHRLPWLLRRRQGRGEQRLHVDLRVGELVHEGRVGAVLQQPAHQVGQQVAVLADRGVDAHRHIAAAHHLAVDRLAHAVQALHLELRAARLAHVQDRGDGAGIVAGELRIDHLAMPDERAGTREVGDVGVVLVGEHRVAGQAQLLRTLDLAVPVGALDQAHHEAQAVRSCDARDLVDHLQRPRLVGLHRQTEAAPLRVRLRDARGQRLENVEREFEAVALLGIDGQVHVGARRGLDELPHARQQLGEDALALRHFVA